MNIVVEGADGSGKSTLVDFLAQSLKWPVVHSEGPTKTADELNARAMRFLAQDRVIFDRHCIVSERVYGTMRGNVMTKPKHEFAFHHQKNLIIYCRFAGPLDEHVAKEHDTREHLDMIQRNHQRILAAYDEWAFKFAHIICRKFDDHSRILKLVKGLIDVNDR